MKGEADWEKEPQTPSPGWILRQVCKGRVPSRHAGRHLRDDSGLLGKTAGQDTNDRFRAKALLNAKSKLPASGSFECLLKNLMGRYNRWDCHPSCGEKSQTLADWDQDSREGRTRGASPAGASWSPLSQSWGRQGAGAERGWHAAGRLGAEEQGGRPAARGQRCLGHPGSVRCVVSTSSRQEAGFPGRGLCGMGIPEGVWSVKRMKSRVGVHGGEATEGSG